VAKDYGQRGSGGRQARPAPKSNGSKKSGGMPGWIWMVAGLSIGLAIAAFVYISRPLQHAEEGGNRAAVMPDKPEKSAGKKEPLKLPPKEKPRFTFYELLPNQEVVVPKDVQVSPKSSGSPDDGVYIIQVASYRSQNDADTQKAKLALLGIESRVEKVTIDNKDTFYRVRIGPDKDLAHVHTTMARLEESGIQGMLVKVK
jgi:cell division protein FtsN